MLSRVLLAGHLHVGAGKLAARAVVVDHEVMRAQDAWVREDLAPDLVDERRVWHASKKRAYGVLHQAKAAPADEDAHGKARPAVEVHARRRGDYGCR